MSDNQEIKKVNGTWNGIPCNIRAVWGKNDVWEGHEFTADERAALFNLTFYAISCMTSFNLYICHSRTTLVRKDMAL